MFLNDKNNLNTKPQHLLKLKLECEHFIWVHIDISMSLQWGSRLGPASFRVRGLLSSLNRWWLRQAVPRNRLGHVAIPPFQVLDLRRLFICNVIFRKCECVPPARFIDPPVLLLKVKEVWKERRGFFADVGINFSTIFWTSLPQLTGLAMDRAPKIVLAMVLPNCLGFLRRGSGGEIQLPYTP